MINRFQISPAINTCSLGQANSPPAGAGHFNYINQLAQPAVWHAYITQQSETLKFQYLFESFCSRSVCIGHQLTDSLLGTNKVCWLHIINH